MTVYSSLDWGEEIYYTDSRFFLVNDTGNDGSSRQTRIALIKVWSVSVRDGDATKPSRENCEWWKEKLF
jgi:hypothetical protein